MVALVVSDPVSVVARFVRIRAPRIKVLETHNVDMIPPSYHGCYLISDAGYGDIASGKNPAILEMALSQVYWKHAYVTPSRLPNSVACVFMFRHAHVQELWQWVSRRAGEVAPALPLSDLNEPADVAMPRLGTITLSLSAWDENDEDDTTQKEVDELLSHPAGRLCTVSSEISPDGRDTNVVIVVWGEGDDE